MKRKYKPKKKAYSIIELSRRGKLFNILRQTDWDKDLVPALFDCQPHNRKKQGDIGSIYVTPSEYSSTAGGSGSTTGAKIEVATSSGSPVGTRTYTGGGGGGSRGKETEQERKLRLQREAAERARQQKLEAARKEKQRQEELNRKKQEQIRQQQIKAGTIAGQVSSVKADMGTNLLTDIPGVKDKPKPFTFGTTPPKVEYGVPIITQEERSQGVVGYVPQGTFSEVVGSGEGFGIQTAPTTPISKFFGRTKKDIVFTQSNIFQSESLARGVKDIKSQFETSPESFIGREGVDVVETEMGKQITLTPTFFEKEFEGTQEEATQQAYDFFGGLSKEQKRRARVSSVASGIYGTGVGIFEGLGTLQSNLAVQTFESPEEFTSQMGLFKGRKFNIGGEIGALSEQPPMPTTTTFLESPTTYVKEKISDPELVTKGVITTGLLTLGGAGLIKNIKTSGIKTGTLSTVEYLSPLRLKPYVYTPTITEQTKFDVVSLKQQRGDYIDRIILGSSKEGTSLVSLQSSKVLPSGIQPGTIITKTTSPAVYVGRGGVISSGYSISGSEGLTYAPGAIGKFTGFGTDKLQVTGIEENVLLGSIFEGYSQPRYNIFLGKTGGGDILGFGTYYPKTTTYKISRGGSISNEINEFLTGFASGKRTSVPGQKIYGDVVVRQPSGTYRIKPTITGKEIDVNKLFEIYSRDSGIVSTGGGKGTSGGGTPLSQTFSDQLLSQQLSSVQGAVSSTSAPTITATTTGSAILGIGAVTKTSTRQTSPSTSQVTTQEVRVVERTATPSLVLESSATSQGEKTAFRLFSPTATKYTTAQTSRFMQAQAFAPAQASALKFKQVSILQPPPIKTFGASAITGFGYGGGILFPPFRLPFGGGTGKKRKKQIRKPKTAYQPSFTALSLGIKVSPKDIENYEKKFFGSLKIRGIPILEKKKARRKTRKEILGV